METSQPRLQTREGEEYVRERGIQEIFQAMTVCLLHYRPDDPVTALLEKVREIQDHGYNYVIDKVRREVQAETRKRLPPLKIRPQTPLQDRNNDGIGRTTLQSFPNSAKGSRLPPLKVQPLPRQNLENKESEKNGKSDQMIPLLMNTSTTDYLRDQGPQTEGNLEDKHQAESFIQFNTKKYRKCEKGKKGKRKKEEEQVVEVHMRLWDESEWPSIEESLSLDRRQVAPHTVGLQYKHAHHRGPKKIYVPVTAQAKHQYRSYKCISYLEEPLLKRQERRIRKIRNKNLWITTECNILPKELDAKLAQKIRQITDIHYDAIPCKKLPDVKNFRGRKKRKIKRRENLKFEKEMLACPHRQCSMKKLPRTNIQTRKYNAQLIQPFKLHISLARKKKVVFHQRHDK